MKRILSAAGVVVAASAVGAGLWLGGSIAAEDSVVRYDRESRYYRIRVLDYPEAGRRCLRFSRYGCIQSSMKLKDPTALDLRYLKSIMAALALHRNPKKVLLVGLGGASIPKFIGRHWPDIRMDIVELDADVVKVCQEFFAFKGSPGMRVILMDGRMYLKRTREKYDVILLDAFAVDYIPFHLTTWEFLRLVRDHLKPDGVVGANLWQRLTPGGRSGSRRRGRLKRGGADPDGLHFPRTRFCEAELRTFQEVFPQTYVFLAGSSGNVIVFGTGGGERVSKTAWSRRAERLAEGKDLGFNLPQLVRNEYTVLTDREIKEPMLTDDKAPVGTLRHEHPRTYGE